VGTSQRRYVVTGRVEAEHGEEQSSRSEREKRESKRERSEMEWGFSTGHMCAGIRAVGK
jgi:hypothetical protein